MDYIQTINTLAEDSYHAVNLYKIYKGERTLVPYDFRMTFGTKAAADKVAAEIAAAFSKVGITFTAEIEYKGSWDRDDYHETHEITRYTLTTKEF